MLMSALALLVGCNPQDAEVNGQFALYLDAKSSENIRRLDARNPVANRLDALELTPVDCRPLVDREEERLDGVDYQADCGAADEATGEWAAGEPEWMTWLTGYPYYLRQGEFGTDKELAPWRTEAVLTSEGDLQLTVHVRMEPFGDFRFGWVVDPDFQPQACVDGEGESQWSQIDDGSWLEHWSTGESGTLWHLTAGSYQLNPRATESYDYWIFPREWSAGYSFSRFGDEEFTGRATDYLDPLYVPIYHGTYGNSGGTLPYDNAYADWLAEVDTALAESNELATLGKSSFPIVYKLEDNAWRWEDETDTDGDGAADDPTAAGLEDWIGVSTSWVRIDNPDAIQLDNTEPVTGDFQIYLETASASSKALVSGSFSITKIREDVWGYDPTLEEIKAEDNGTPECGTYEQNFD